MLHDSDQVSGAQQTIPNTLKLHLLHITLVLAKTWSLTKLPLILYLYLKYSNLLGLEFFLGGLLGLCCKFMC
ncbi:hypothetical protein NC651_027869 [Populus alba x Populus x berolinensis]|nr:hypothetical protein NC651_027869 [Populus alba x Populus x berolinensis]